MISRFKKIFNNKKKKTKEPQVKVFTYNSDMQLIHPNDPQHPLTNNTTINKSTVNKKNQLELKNNEPITNLDTSTLPPTAIITHNIDNNNNNNNNNKDKDNNSNTNTSMTKSKKKVAPFQLQIDVENLKEKTTTTTKNDHDMTEEEKQLQEQANLWIEKSNRRRSTLPVYSNLDRYEIIQKLGE
ncbi:hypothetical protein BJ944DRAFT_231856 [Cunninghamella echinulata]|nr:hypothetical protein BJ944DRAFT_231856 [Cunninghamella echinulata]